VCGDGFCAFGESVDNCPADCLGGRFCGDGFCTDSENATNCPPDCRNGGARCGNGLCEGIVEILICPRDCGPIPIPIPPFADGGIE
jgi:hypothetical protein